MLKQSRVKVAILDLYEGVENQGMRCIREILNQYGELNNIDVIWDEFEVRKKKELPSVKEYDIFISSGGPGSPLESEGSEWENAYFGWLENTLRWNNHPEHDTKKYVFFICHSFQLACRFFNVGEVCKRKSTAFGVFPVHMLEGGHDENVFYEMNNPFYAVDSRDYQVVQPDWKRIQEIGAKVLCIEKERPHVPYERAVMAIRFNEFMIGTQFHPEADAVGMTMYLLREDKKETVIKNHGEEKWKSMLEHLNDPDKIMWTQSRVLPNFLMISIEQLEQQLADQQ